jgi:hypothetical protein
MRGKQREAGAGSDSYSRERCSVTSYLPVVMLDDPGPFEPLETWEQFLAAVEAMPDFQGKQRQCQVANSAEKAGPPREASLGYGGCADYEI